MSDFEPLATVRVIKQPEDTIAYIEGVSGFVEDILSDGYYLFHAIDLSGESAGRGRVPGKCLIDDKAPHLAKARDKILNEAI